MDPYYKQQQPVIENAHGVPFSLLCDESNEEGDSVKLLTILIRFCESEHSTIHKTS